MQCPAACLSAQPADHNQKVQLAVSDVNDAHMGALSASVSKRPDNAAIQSQPLRLKRQKSVRQAVTMKARTT
jgi:hypothetical protein